VWCGVVWCGVEVRWFLVGCFKALYGVMVVGCDATRRNRWADLCAYSERLEEDDE
jgi:hypothetical protein